ncbi:hypothetical protein BD410DRAFT_845483 [Rickenella mellea]|uniref:RlpA-like protein double-psi beta-barrel domain-containing protein n=1 Tax=Rickenella mellea TaxID=50990 RepID=A0A4Y7PJD1_9AGAM|nr:hypothetical protein BD410DRAFT_845483 [Rickenella mellea]
MRFSLALLSLAVSTFAQSIGTGFPGAGDSVSVKQRLSVRAANPVRMKYIIKINRTFEPEQQDTLDAPTDFEIANTANDITGGFATFFTQDGIGACGIRFSDNDLIGAMSPQRFQAKPDGTSALCGKQVVITNTKNNKQVTVAIQDECPNCSNRDSIGLTRGAFQIIAELSDGEVPISWHFI